MANKVRFYEAWDLYNILKTIGVLSFFGLVMLIYYNYPNILNQYKLSKYDAEITGVLIDMEEKVIIRQSQLGNRVQVDHYLVKFGYEIDEEIYTNTDQIDGTSAYRSRLKRILKSENKSVKVRYLSNAPEKSIIDLSE